MNTQPIMHINYERKSRVYVTNDKQIFFFLQLMMFCPDPFGNKNLTLKDFYATDFEICQDLEQNKITAAPV